MNGSGTRVHDKDKGKGEACVPCSDTGTIGAGSAHVDAIGITGESENFTGQDRHLLSNSTVFGLAKDLASMNHAQRVNAYCEPI